MIKYLTPDEHELQRDLAHEQNCGIYYLFVETRVMHCHSITIYLLLHSTLTTNQYITHTIATKTVTIERLAILNIVISYVPLVLFHFAQFIAIN